MFSRNSSFYLASAVVGLSVSKGSSKVGRGRDGTYFMDFKALGREPDISVKMYLSTQKQAREGVAREVET